MAKRWTKEEEVGFRKELDYLYIQKNLSIREISIHLRISQSAVFVRLNRLGIATAPEKKKHYLNKRTDINIPQRHTVELAEMFGILLGDGHISKFQVVVSLGSKEQAYAVYVQELLQVVFGGKPKIGIRKEDYKKQKYRDVYLGSVELVSWIRKQGLVSNKVQSQVGVPSWIMLEKRFMKAFIRGFFDTDGSVYRLRFGLQISLTNRSMPILKALQSMLWALEYSPSQISAHKVYLTKKEDVERFFREITPKNLKHVSRFNMFYASVV